MARTKGLPKKHCLIRQDGRKLTTALKTSKSSPYESYLMRKSKYFQSNDFVMSKHAFKHLFTQVLRTLSPSDQSFIFEAASLLAMQEASEFYLVCLFQDLQECAMHAGRTEVMPGDLDVTMRIRRNK